MIGLLLMEPQCYPESHEHAHLEVTTDDAKVTIIKPFGSFAAFFPRKNRHTHSLLALVVKRSLAK
ncbi:hypothetical protein KP17_05465 [Pectobacterium parvum]|nr:hypothetical protein KP17_05465 [Pectobacterium parvum]KHS97966.1 hypothetical protein RC88_04150 [Pectobacterium parvum]